MILFCCRHFHSYSEGSSKSTEILISGIVGVLTGVIASWIFSYQSKLFENRKLKRHFEPIAGNFIRWWEDSKVKGNNRVFCRARIEYLTDNKLSIEVSTLIYHGRDTNYGVDYTIEQIERWTGEMIMDTVRSGTVVWEQRSPNNGNNGFKRIIVDKDLKGFSLVGEVGFGVERFTERETK